MTNLTTRQAGLHTGDQHFRFNGSLIETDEDFVKLRDGLCTGATVLLEVMHAGKVRQAIVTIKLHDWPVVKSESCQTRPNDKRPFSTAGASANDPVKHSVCDC